MRKLSFFLWALLLVDGVFGVEKEEVSVSVMEGDSVTLNPSTEIPEDDTIQWWFGDKSIAVMNKADGLFSTSDGEVVGFKDRLELDPQTGSLTITNIRTTDSGLYKLEIKSRIETYKNFTVSVRDVFSDEKDGVKTVSETAGDSILLHTHVTEIQQNDPIEWTFGPQNIPVAKTDGKSNSISYNYNDERFKNRLYLDIRTGDLTIKKSSSEHSGHYQLKIITSSYTIQKSFSVTVSGSGLSPGAVAGIVSVVVLLLVFAVVIFTVVICYRRKISEVKGCRDLEKNGTNDPLKTGTDGRDVL